MSECQSVKSIKSGVKWRTLLRNKWRPFQRNRGDLCVGMGGVLCVGIVATFAAEYPRDYAKLIFNCNELPRDVENTNAYFRRFIILPFNITISADKQDKELSKKIINSELSGIFNWVLNGLKKLLENKNFTESEIVKNQIHQYEIESDSVLMFLEDENYEKSLSKTIRLNNIYYEYRTYCSNNGFVPCSCKKFSQRLEKNKVIKKRTSECNVVYLEKKFNST